MIEHSSDDRLQSANGKTKRLFVVGIGSSAGGVDALRRFFRHVPPDCGMAFVVIMHLSPNHESSLPALLQTQTTIPVMRVTEAVKVEPGHIYVIPPRNNLIMVDGMIQLTEPEQPHATSRLICSFALWPMLMAKTPLAYCCQARAATGRWD